MAVSYVETGNIRQDSGWAFNKFQHLTTLPSSFSTGTEYGWKEPEDDITTETFALQLGFKWEHRD